MTNSVPVSELQSASGFAIIELFELELTEGLHYTTNDTPDTKLTYRWHNGSSRNDNRRIFFGGNAYDRMPIKADGFEYNGAQASSLPRPTLTVSNLFSTITAVLTGVNAVTPGNDLTGAKVTRIRTLARFLDADSFPTDVKFLIAEDGRTPSTYDGHLLVRESNDPAEDGNNLMAADLRGNPFGTPNANNKFPDEIYYIDRKATETRDFVEFELASLMDLAGVKLPKRQVLPKDFPGVGTFIG